MSLYDIQSESLIKKNWVREYEEKGIPSSFRKDASSSLIGFLEWVKRTGNLKDTNALDIGAGRGRNSFYLVSQGFKVTAIELLEENVQFINTEAALQDLPLKAFACDAGGEWPLLPDSLEIAVDIFCYKHIVDKSKQRAYRKALWSSLKPEGFYFISLASEKDGFYGPLLKDSLNLKEKLIVDPFSHIPSFLYSKQDLVNEFSPYFEVVWMEEVLSTSPMYEKEYPRVVINAVFKKKAF